MTAIVLTQEFMASRNRFQRTLMISLILHAIFFAWLLLRQNLSPVPEGIVEISWLEPAPTRAPPAAEPVQAKPEPVVPPKTVVPSASEEKFVRQEEPAPAEPTPQELTANRDRVKERVAALSTTRLPSSALVTQPKASRTRVNNPSQPDSPRRSTACSARRSGT